jgi:hypothetical protein
MKLTLEKQNSDLVENLNAQTNITNQLKTQYTNILKLNSSLEKQLDDLREKNNNLLIQKDLLDNEILNLKSSIEMDKESNRSLALKLSELETTVQCVLIENNKLKDRESFNANELSKLKSIIMELERDKTNLEFQLKNIEQNINNNLEIDEGSVSSTSTHQSHVSSEILKKFNEERKTRHLAEEKCLMLEKNLRMLSSDLDFMKEDHAKKEREVSDEIFKMQSLKKDLDLELNKRAQECIDLNAEISNLRIKEKHLTKISADLKEESQIMREECDRLRKVTIETENTKVKKLQEEIDELKTINSLYRSQRLESDDEINNLIRDKEKLKSELHQMRKEL